MQLTAKPDFNDAMCPHIVKPSQPFVQLSLLKRLENLIANTFGTVLFHLAKQYSSCV